MPKQVVHPTAGYSLCFDAWLTQCNTLRVAAQAHCLARLHDAGSLPALFRCPAVHKSDVLILGEGSNVLFTDHYPGTVVIMHTRGIQIENQNQCARITVAAGERWDDLVRWTLGQGLAGLENLILIPGTTGAAPIQNIGAYGTEVAEFIESVEAWDTFRQCITLLDHAECAFGYRNSIFRREPGRYVVTAVHFILPHQHRLRLDYPGINEELTRMGVIHPTPFHVAEAVIRLRNRKLPDPAIIGNAGSFFRNPLVKASQAHAMKQAHPALPMWRQPDDQYKLSAAWLIETAGFKGFRQGDAGISSRHALVLVNHGQASGKAIWALARQVIESVSIRFGVTLEPEPMVIGT